MKVETITSPENHITTWAPCTEDGGLSYLLSELISQYTPADNNPLAGIVISQAVMISPATLQRTLLTRSEEPTPMIAELTTCDVLTGTPKREADRITSAELNCVEKLCTGRIL